MSGSSYPLSGDNRRLLSQNNEFFESLVESLNKTKLELQGDDAETKIERVQNGDKIEITFVYPLDTNKESGDGRIYLRDKFVFSEGGKKYQEFKREFQPHSGNKGKNWEEWLESLKKGKGPSQEQIEKFAATLAQRFVGTEYWRSFDKKFTAALRTQENFLMKAAQAAASQNPNLSLSMGDPQTAFALRYPGKDLEVVITYALDDDEKVLNGRAFLTDTLLLDGTTKKLKQAERKWSLSAQAESSPAWQDTLTKLKTLSPPSTLEYSAFADAIAPALPLLSAEKFNATLVKVSPVDAFLEQHGAALDRRGKKTKAEQAAKAGAAAETLEMLFALAQERLGVQEDASKGWLHFGATVDAKGQSETLKAVFDRASEQAKSGGVRSAFDLLRAAAVSDAEKAALARITDDKLCQELNDAGQEPDTKLRHETLIRFSRSQLLMDNQLGGAAKFIADKLKDDANVAPKALEVSNIVEGKGSFGQKFEMFSQTFVDRAADPAMIGATMVAGVAGPTAELVGLKWFAGLGRFRNVSSALMGIGVESFAFTAVHKLGESAHHDPSKILAPGQFFKDWGSTASLFVGMRLMHAGVGWGSNKMAESNWGQKFKLGETGVPGSMPVMIGPTGRVLPNYAKAQLTARGEALTGFANHVGGVAGMTGMAYFNEFAFGTPEDWQKKQGFWGHVNDSILMYGDSMLGFHMANRASNNKLQLTVGDMRFRIEAEKGKLPGIATAIPDPADPAASPAVPAPVAAATPGAPPPDPKFSIFAAVREFFANRLSLKNKLTQLEIEKAEATRKAEALQGELELARQTATAKDGEVTRVNDILGKADRQRALDVALARQETAAAVRSEEAKKLEAAKKELEDKIKLLEAQVAGTDRGLPPAMDAASGPKTSPDPAVADTEAEALVGPPTAFRPVSESGLPAEALLPPEPRPLPADGKFTDARTLISEGNPLLAAAAEARRLAAGSVGEDDPTVVRPMTAEARKRLEIEGQLEKAVARIEELEALTETLKGEKGEAESFAGEQTKKVGETLKELRAAKRQLASMQEKAAAAEAAQQALDELRPKLEQAEQAAVGLREEIEAKTSRISELETQAGKVAELEAARATLEKEKTELEDKFTAASRRVEEIEHEVETEKAKLKTANAEFAEERAQLEKINVAAERRAEQAEDAILAERVKGEQALAEEKAAREAAEKKLSEGDLVEDPAIAEIRLREQAALEERVRIAEAKVSEAEAKLAEAEGKQREAEARSKAATHEVETLTERLRSQGEEASSSSSRLNSEKADLQLKLGEANIAKAEAEQALGESRSEVERLRREAEGKASEFEKEKAAWESEKARLEGESAGRQLRVRELEGELQGSQARGEARAKELSAELEAARGELAGVNRRLGELDAAKLGLEETLGKRDKALAAQRTLTKSLTEELDAVKAENERMVAKARADLRFYEDEKAEADSAVRRLQGELEQLRKDRSSDQEGAAAREGELNEKLRQANLVVQDQAAKLEKAKARLEKVEHDAGQREMELSSTIFSLTEDAKELRKKIETLEGAVRVKETRIQRLTESEAALRKSILKTDGDVAALREQVETLTREKNEALAQIKKLQGEVSNLTDKKQELEAESIKQREELAALVIERNGLRNDVHRLTGELKTSETKVKNRDAELEKAKARIAELDAKEEALTKAHKGTEEQLRRATKSLENREAELTRLRETTAAYVNEVTEKLRKAGDVIDAKEAETKDLQKLLLDKVSEFAALQKEKLAAEQALGARQQDLERMTRLHQAEMSRADRAEGERDVKQTIIEAKDVEIEQKRGALAAAMSTVGKLTKEKTRLEGELAKLQEEFDKKDEELGAAMLEMQELAEKKQLGEAEAQGRIAGLQFRINEVNAEVSELRAGLLKESKRAELGEGFSRALHEKLELKTAEAERLTQSLAEEQQRAKGFGEKYLEVKKQVEGLEREKFLAGQSVANLKRQVASIREARTRSEQKLRETITRLEGESKEKGRLLHVANNRIVVLEANLEQARKDRDTFAAPYNKKIRELQGQLGEQKSIAEQSGRKATHAKSELETVRKELQRLNAAALERNKALVEQLEQQKGTTQAEKDRARQISTELGQAREAHAQEKAKLDLRVRDLESVLSASQTAHQGAVRMLRQVEALRDRTLADKEKAIGKKNAEIETLQESVLRLEKALLEEKENVKAVLADLERAEARHQRELDTHQRNILALEETLERRLRAYRSMEQRLGQEQERGAASVRTFTGLNEQLAAKDHEVSTARAELEAEKAKYLELHREKGELEKLRGELAQRLQELTADRDNINTQLGEARDMVEKHVAALASQKEELDAAREQVRQHVDAAKERAAEVSAANAAKETATAETARLRADLERAQRAKGAAEQAHSKLSSELESVREQARQSAEAAARVPELERQLGIYTEQGASQAIEIERLNGLLTGAKQAKESAEKAQANAEIALALEQDKLAEANEKFTEASAQFDDIQKRLGTAEETFSYYKQLLAYREQRASQVWDAGDVYQLNPHSVIMIGRSGANDIVIPERSVSRQQAQLWFDGEKWQIRDVRDLQEENPTEWNADFRTRLNGEVLPPGKHVLSDMDLVGYGYGPHFDLDPINHPEASDGNFGDVVLLFRQGAEPRSGSLQEISLQEAERIFSMRNRQQPPPREAGRGVDPEDVTAEFTVTPPPPPDPVPPSAPRATGPVEPTTPPAAPSAQRFYVMADVLKTHGLTQKYKAAMQALYGAPSKEVATALQRLYANFHGLEERFSLDQLAAATDLQGQNKFFDDMAKAYLEAVPANASPEFKEQARADFETVKKAQKSLVEPTQAEAFQVMQKYGTEIRGLFGIGTDAEARMFAVLYKNFPKLEEGFNPKAMAEVFHPEKTKDLTPEKLAEAIDRHFARKGLAQVHNDRAMHNEQNNAREAIVMIETLKGLLKARLAPETLPKPAAYVPNPPDLGHQVWSLDRAQGAKITRDVFSVNDTDMSRYHADIYFNPQLGQWVYRDHSGNGSLVNARKVHNAEKPLQHGDLVQFGNQLVNFFDDAAGPRLVGRYDFRAYGDFSLGNHPSNQVAVLNSDPLPIQTKFEYVNGEWRVTDVSQNGVLLNGYRMSPGNPYQFPVGHLLSLGNVHLQRFEDPLGLRMMQVPPQRQVTNPGVDPAFAEAARAAYVAGHNGVRRRSDQSPQFRGYALHAERADILILHRVKGEVSAQTAFVEDPNAGVNAWRVKIPMKKEEGFMAAAKRAMASEKDVVRIEISYPRDADDPGAPRIKVTNLAYEEGIRVVNQGTGKDLPLGLGQHLYVNPGDKLVIEGMEIPLFP